MFSSKILLNRYFLLFIFLTIYYFVLPLVFLFENFVSSQNIFTGEVNFINESNNKLIFLIYSLISIFFLFFIFLYLQKNLTSKQSEKRNEFKLVFSILSLVCIFFLILDLINIINYRLENIPFYRSLMYEAILNKRNTHINILIIVATANFYENKSLSLFSYILLIAYSFLTYSRIELILLISIIFCTININAKYRNFIYSIFILLGIFIIFYRFYLSGQNVFYVLMDPLHLTVNTYNLLNNYNLTEFYFLINENVKFLLKDMFYFNLPLYNFFQNDILPTYSKKGFDTVLIYPLVFVIYSFIFLFMKKNFFIPQYFLSSIFVYLIISLFRGNFVHNIAFIIKLYLILIVSEWIVRRTKLWLSRGG